MNIETGADSEEFIIVSKNISERLTLGEDYFYGLSHFVKSYKDFKHGNFGCTT